MTRQPAQASKDLIPAISLGKATPGQQWEGKYVGRRDVPTKDGKGSAIYTIRDGGKDIEFWKCAALDLQLAQTPPGSYVWITFNEKRDIGGGKSFIDVTVEFDPEYNDSEIPF